MTSLLTRSTDRPVPLSGPTLPDLRAFVARAYRWHRPLMLLAAASLVLLVGCLVGVAVDPRVLTGVPIWEKPAKFAVSIALYAVTIAWLISLMPRHRRLGSVLGTVSAVTLAGELVAIVTQVVRGRTSHFDFATPFDTAVYESMAVLVGTLWLANLALVVWLLVQRLPDRALTWALRLGMIIAVVGMALAYLMTLPTPAQRQALDGDAPVAVIGAHTVGSSDGGPGLPVLGWSTVGGDLRIPHFVGIHGLQAMIVCALVLTLLARRVALLADEGVRLRLVAVVAAAYVGVLAVLTSQALRGQSVVHPDLVTVSATTVVLGLAALAAGGVLVRTRARRAAPVAVVG